MCLVVAHYNFTIDTVVPKFKTVQCLEVIMIHYGVTLFAQEKQ